jgi:hypothetical protein
MYRSLLLQAGRRLTRLPHLPSSSQLIPHGSSQESDELDSPGVGALGWSDRTLRCLEALLKQSQAELERAASASRDADAAHRRTVDELRAQLVEVRCCEVFPLLTCLIWALICCVALGALSTTRIGAKLSTPDGFESLTNSSC